ncbi:ABC transporter substrate-binding protein [Ideonella sp. YS5]|uniref:ABC transporter substrate-binding protein n=1 Tax=Ideonella sp. YS5 TaxID=3453714 RepID=UPI003EEADB8E
MAASRVSPARAATGLLRVLAFGLLSSLGVARADIVIGQVAPFSGPQAVTGKAIHAGAKLYFDSLNASGGVRGQKIRLAVRDDAQQSEQTVRLVKELITAESPVAMLGTVGTSNLEAVAADGVLARSHVPMVGAISGAATVVQAENMLVVKARYRDEVARLFANLAHVGVQRVGLVYQDDGLGKDVLSGAAGAAKDFNITLVDSASYPRNTTDTSAAVAKMNAAAPQAIFLGATTAAAVDFVTRYRASGGRAQLFGMSIIDTDVLLKKVGPDLARGYAFSTVLPLPTETRRAVVREFATLRAASKDPDLTARSMEGFIAAKALAWALKQAPSLTPAGVATALAASGGFDAGDYTLDFSEKGRSGSRYVGFAMIGPGGKLVQ